MIVSMLAEGFSLSTAFTALVTFAFVNPRRTRAVVASSTMPLSEVCRSVPVSHPAPLTILSFSSIISLWALFVPIPLILLILFMSSAMIAFLISSEESEDSIILAVDAPIPDTPIRSLNSSRSSFVLNP